MHNPLAYAYRLRFLEGSSFLGLKGLLGPMHIFLQVIREKARMLLLLLYTDVLWRR